MKNLKVLLKISLVVMPALSLVIFIILGAAYVGRAIHSSSAEAAEIQPGKEAGKDKQRSIIPAKTLTVMDTAKAVEEGGKLVQTLQNGTGIIYTIHPKRQEQAEAILEASQALAGSLVLVHVKTGKILVLAEYRNAEYSEESLPVYFSSKPPAASLFKVVTASALLKKNAADVGTVVCYHGGSSKLHMSNLQNNPEKDKNCATLSFAMGKSLNSVFAKLADTNLSVEDLEGAGERYGFGKQIPLQYSTQPQVSKMEIPAQRLEFAKTAAGFWHVQISPLHAAMVAQAVANDGGMLEPVLVEEIKNSAGKVQWKSSATRLMQCTTETDAEKLTKMMIETVTKGTARKHFYDPQGRPYLPGIQVAGKTGSLSQKSPFRFYSWFIGFAPAQEPEVAVASLVVNGLKWKMKGATMARELLRKYYYKALKKKHQAPKK